MTSLYIYYTQVIFLSLIVINHVVEIYLSRRQLAALQQSRGEVPGPFKHYLSYSDHEKAITYSSEKIEFGIITLLWDVAVLFYWFPFRGAEKLYLAIPDYGIHREVIFLMAFGLISTLLTLPGSAYSTFVIEEKYGFNRTTAKLWIKDRLKAAALGLILLTPILYAVLYIFEKLGDYWWLVAFIVLTAFQFILVWLYPTFIAPLFNKFKPLESEDLKHGIEGLVSRAGFKAQGVFIMDASRRSSHGNAYFTGFGKAKRVVFFDTLLAGLETKEVLAILAHELGHLKLKHIPKSLVLSLALSFIGFFLMGRLAHESWFYGGHFVRAMSPGILFFLFSKAVPVYTFLFSPISSWISRKREFEADAYAAKETSGADLVTGLLKLYQQNSSPVVSDKLYSGFYHSHPPALERIERLNVLEREARQ